MADATLLADNAASTVRLERLVARLKEADMQRDLGGGWTVTTALAHLGFWDRRFAYAFNRWVQEGTPYVVIDNAVINYALEPMLAAVDPRAAGGIAVAAAKELDAAIESMTDAMVGDMEARQLAFMLNRERHRNDHIQQIEAVLPSR